MRDSRRKAVTWLPRTCEDGGEVKKVLLGVVIAGVLMVGGCLALVGGGLAAVDQEMKQDDKTAANGGVTSITNDDAVKHVTLKSCKIDGFGLVTARLKIHNRGDDQATYAIAGEVLAGKRRVGEFFATSNDVRPGQRVTTQGSGTVSKTPPDYSCKLVSVDRF